MKKILVPAALLALGGAAQAQLSLYGLIDVCYGKSLYGSVFLDAKADVHSGGDNGNSECNSTSRFGLKGSTDVGGGTKINFNLQSNGITSDGEVNSPFFGRQAWLGFSGGFGEVRVGRQDSVSFQTMIDFDFNGASNGVSAGFYSFVGAWFPGRQSRSIQYISPSMSGFSVHLGLRPKGNSQDGDKTAGSFGLKYADGPIAAAVSFQGKLDSAAKNFSSVAGSYDFGVAKVMASYANGGKFADGGTGKGYVLGVTAPVAGFNIGAHYGNNSDEDLKIKSWELFVNREIFKNTYAYVEAGNWKTSLDVNPLQGILGTTDKTKGSGYAVGVIYVF